MVQMFLLHHRALPKFHVIDHTWSDLWAIIIMSKRTWWVCILCIPFILSGSPNEGGFIGAVVSQEDRDQTVTEKNEAPLSNEVHIGNNIVTLLLLPCWALSLPSSTQYGICVSQVSCCCKDVMSFQNRIYFTLLTFINVTFRQRILVNRGWVPRDKIEPEKRPEGQVNMFFL